MDRLTFTKLAVSRERQLGRFSLNHLAFGSAILASLIGAIAANGVAPDAGRDCLDVERTASLYFQGFAKSYDEQWYARRLCQLEEPPLGPSAAAHGQRSARCVFYESFQPVVVLRLDEATCRLHGARLDDMQKAKLNIGREVKQMQNCGILLDQFSRYLAKGGGAEVIPKDVIVSDGRELFYEFYNESGELHGVLRQPLRSRSQQTGAAAACQMLLDAQRLGAPASPPAR
jgi:hypothetical protein